MTVVPIYSILLVPDANVYLKTELYQMLTGKDPAAEEKLVLIVAKEDQKREDFEADSFYPIGLKATIN